MLKFALHTYVPNRYLKWATFEELETRRLILGFKDGMPYATRWAANEIANALSQTDMKDTIIVCIPASCKRTHDRRFKAFSQMVCEKCGAVNGFDFIQVYGHRQKAHIDHVHALAEDTDKYIHMDESRFKGKRVIIIDDIVTTCKTANAFVDRMITAGAYVRMVLFLGMTKYFKRYND